MCEEIFTDYVIVFYRYYEVRYYTVELVLLMSNLIYFITFISYQGHAVIAVEIYFNIDVARSLMLTKLCCSNDGQWFFNLFQVIEL